jgi:hypothetical protein
MVELAQNTIELAKVRSDVRQVKENTAALAQVGPDVKQVKLELEKTNEKDDCSARIDQHSAETPDFQSPTQRKSSSTTVHCNGPISRLLLLYSNIKGRGL